MLFNRKFGIEIECMLPRTITRSQLATLISNAGVPCFDAVYSHQRVTSWKIVSDGSLSGGNGMELVSPPMQGEGSLAQIETVCRVLNEQGASVNRSCGLHVHIEAGNLSAPALRKLAAIYIENENIIDSLMPLSRRGSNNHYCGSLRGANMSALSVARNASDIAHAVSHGNRYVKLNFSSFLRHGTVEFRHHSGTVDADKIIKWLACCQRLVACAVKEADQPISGALAVGGQARPRGHTRRARRLQMIYDAMQRPGGVSRQEMSNLLNRRTLLPMNRILRGAGFSYRVEHRYGDRRTERYVLAEQVTTPTTEAPVAAMPITFDSFCSRIEMSETDKVFWVARRQAVAAQGMAAAA